MLSIYRPVLCVCFLCIAAFSFSQSTRMPAQRIADSVFRLNALPPRPAGRPVAVSNRDGHAVSAVAVRQATALKNSNLQFTVCYDTSGRYFLKNDTAYFYVYKTIRSSDGAVMVTGEYAIINAPYRYGGFLMKCADTGTVQWARLYDSAAAPLPHFALYYEIAELGDGSFVLAGRTNNNVKVCDDILLTRVDRNGNLIWSKTFASRLWQGFNGSGDYFFIKQLAQDPNGGDIYLTAAHWQNGKNVTRFRVTDGSIVWSRYYGTNSAYVESPFGMDFTPSDMIVFSKLGGYNNGYVFINRINKATGDTLQIRNLVTNDPSGYKVAFLQPEQVQRLNNGHYALSGKMYNYYLSVFDTSTQLHHAGVLEIDQNFNFVKAWYIGNSVSSNYYNTRISINQDGTGVFSMANVFSGYNADVYYIQFRDGQILKQRRKEYRNAGLPSENLSLRMNDGGDLVVKLVGDSITNHSSVEFLNLHLSDTGSACIGYDDNSSYIRSFRYESSPGWIDSVNSNDLSESSPKAINSRPIILNYEPACRQISYCDTVSLVPDRDTVCVGAPVTFTVRKNKACGASIFSRFDSSMVQSFDRLNDSVYQVSFQRAGRTNIAGSIYGCRLLTDSFRVVVLPSAGKLNLGPDTSICPGNSIVLNAHKGYRTYTWQDGSSDSILTVKLAGTYTLTVTDSCGNLYRDTVTVSQKPPIPFDIGADQRICPGNSTAIIAPPSFLNYTWTPNYKISSTTGQTVTVSPVVDTVYHVRAEKTPGCFAEDSVRITVVRIPPVDLGPDKSFCAGDSVVLNAGPGYTSYGWNTGSQQQQITVFSAGQYSVVAADANGCKASDTMQVLTVYAKPLVDLGNDSVLCTGTLRVLNAGNFSTYAWNTGSTQPAIQVSHTGIYSVSVTDIHQCRGEGTINISTQIDPPAAFLPADTSICSYGKALLQPSKTYPTYNWSNGASTASITVSAAGTYWLEVKDKYHCSGRDSIVLKEKDCMLGFYIPNAFSPGHDGRNDIFRPLIFGNVLNYEFRIYNRFGQLVFSTSELKKGWDGTVNGSPAAQSTTVFVWTCRYQIENQAADFRKGSFLLIR